MFGSGSPPAPDSALSEKLKLCPEGMVRDLNNLIFNLFSPPARTRSSGTILPQRRKLQPDPSKACKGRCTDKGKGASKGAGEGAGQGGHGRHRGGPPAPDLALDEKLRLCPEGMVLGLNNLIFNCFFPPARTRKTKIAHPDPNIHEQCPNVMVTWVPAEANSRLVSTTWVPVSWTPGALG